MCGQLEKLFSWFINTKDEKKNNNNNNNIYIELTAQV